MNSLQMLRIFLISFWIQAELLSLVLCNTGINSHLSKEDILLLKDEENPKCFTRTLEDFTCFLETAHNRTLDLYYKYHDVSKRCEMSISGPEDGTFLHVCFFPSGEILLFTHMEIQVVERANKTDFYSRTISVEDHYLPNPPFNVSIKPNGHVGQLDVFWDTKAPPYAPYGGDERYKIRYSSRNIGEQIKLADKKHLQLILEPGDQIEVQVAVKSGFSSEAGHWSSWSRPVRAPVPQSSVDISLVCSTPDLQNVTCTWNETRYGAKTEYKLFYKTSSGKSLNWTEWTEYLTDGNITNMCSFTGLTELSEIKIKLISTSDTVNRTFFSEVVTVKHSIKTGALNLRGNLSKDKFCLEWEVPLPSLWHHLQYEVHIHIEGGEQWSRIKGPDNNTCVEVPPGCQFSVKIRAQPIGPVYSGSWSDWSDILNGEIPFQIDMVLMMCILVPMLIITITSICVFYFNNSKIKQHFWPPVPNLENVLQVFLTDINSQKWDHPPITVKQCFEETTSSVVEIISEDEIPGLDNTSVEFSKLLSSAGNFSTDEHEDGSPKTDSVLDYVTLNKELCNNYVNHSYLAVSKSADMLNFDISAEKGPDNLYTNFLSESTIQPMYFISGGSGLIYATHFYSEPRIPSK